MNKEEFDKLRPEEQRHLLSEYRKTAHAGELIFFDDENAHSLTTEETKQKLLKERDELLKQIYIEQHEEKNNNSRKI